MKNFKFPAAIAGILTFVGFFAMVTFFLAFVLTPSWSYGIISFVSFLVFLAGFVFTPDARRIQFIE
jgi:hypothetical protein